MNRELLEREVNLLHNRVCVALGDPKRIMVLYFLAEGGAYVNDIASLLDMPQPTVSRHLRVLRDRGLVLTERRGTSVFYTLSDHRVIEALDLLRGILASQLEDHMELTQKGMLNQSSIKENL